MAHTAGSAKHAGLKIWKNFKSMDPQNFFTPGKDDYMLAAVRSSREKSGLQGLWYLVRC